MPRIARLVVKEEEAVYHIISRTVLEGYVLGDVEKDFLLQHIRQLSRVYFAEVYGFCIMGDHFHLLVRIGRGQEISSEEIRSRFNIYYGEDTKRELSEDRIPVLGEKWGSVSEFVREIKQGFSRFYNRRHHRKGFFWSERFKSVIVEKGETLLNCLAYIDLNPIRAGIVEKPEEYRWCSLGYHVQTKNRGRFLSFDFGLEAPTAEKYASLSEGKRKGQTLKSEKAKLAHYMRFVHEKAGLLKGSEDSSKEPGSTDIDRFQLRNRYFSDSGIIGRKEFVSEVYQNFKGYFSSRHEKRPKRVHGLNGIYSLKRLSENIE